MEIFMSTPLHSVACALLAATIATGCAWLGDRSAESEGRSSMPSAHDGAASASPDGMSGTPDPQMQAVLDQLGELGARPVSQLTPEEARQQPSPADAVEAVLTKQGKSTAPTPVGKVENRSIDGPGGAIPIRIYWPQGMAEGQTSQAPILLYIHGGGWVIANLDTYDSSARALANAADAIVVSTHYRQAPEHPFPAAHEDTYAAYRWVLENADSLGGDRRNVAVAGESAGGNMAAAVALRARDEGIQQPAHQLLVYPVADARVGTTASEQQNTQAKPLGTAALSWFYSRYLRSPDDGRNPYFSILNAELTGVAPATVITAQIDPLRSEGQAYAERLRAAGVPVRVRNFEGVTHEFFGMGAVLDDARDAVAFAADGLKQDMGTASR